MIPVPWYPFTFTSFPAPEISIFSTLLPPKAFQIGFPHPQSSVYRPGRPACKFFQIQAVPPQCALRLQNLSLQSSANPFYMPLLRFHLDFFRFSALLPPCLSDRPLLPSHISLNNILLRPIIHYLYCILIKPIIYYACAEK